MSASDSSEEESTRGSLSALGLAAIGSLWRRAAATASSSIMSDTTVITSDSTTNTTTASAPAIADIVSNPDADAKK